LFSAFCFNFTNPGKRELREIKKRKEKKKAMGQPGLADPAACCSQSANSQACLYSSFLTLHQAVMYFKKLA
jgi:hypothetical protein